MLRTVTLSIIACLLSASVATAKNVKVLFIGNSYVYTNDLPLIIKNMATASGDNMTYSSNIPGGATFQDHTGNTTTLSLLAQGGWDFVVLQEQSQRPSFSDGQVASQVYPYARTLDSLVHVYSPCAKTVFYMTWGRKNGDASNCAVWPPICTYAGMDSLLQLRYGIMADNNNAWLSPVAKVWRRLRTQNPSIELYNPDESHPSEAGSFAAACSFYSIFFGKDPAANTYAYTLGASTATTIKNAAKAIVYDSLKTWRQHDPLPQPAFNRSIASKTLTLTNQSQNATGYKWSFGDGNTSTQTSPAHTYAANGTYNVCLTAFDNCDTVTFCQSITIGNVGIPAVPGNNNISIFPNPANGSLSVAGLTSDAHYDLFDVGGRKCADGLIKQSNPVLYTGQLPAGNYFLHISDKTGIQTQLKVSVLR